MAKLDLRARGALLAESGAGLVARLLVDKGGQLHANGPSLASWRVLSGCSIAAAAAAAVVAAVVVVVVFGLDSIVRARCWLARDGAR